MDAPPIQYARTADGVNIAYWTLGGAGPPLVYVPPAPGFRAALQFPAYRDHLKEFAERFSLVSLDSRDTGDSDHGIRSLSLDDFVEDLRAVVDAAALSRFTLAAFTWATPVTVRFAVQYPDRVSHLVLNVPILRGDRAYTPMGAALGNVFPPDVQASATATMFGLDAEDGRDGLGGWFEQIRTNPDRDAMTAARSAWDVTGDIPIVAAPTLVVRSPNEFYRDAARETTAAMPDARLFVADRMFAPLGEVVAEFVRDSGTQSASQTASSPSVGSRRMLAKADSLSPRELEVLAEVALGKRNADIAERLSISSATVTRHISNILNKTGLSNRTELAALAIEQRLTGGDE